MDFYQNIPGVVIANAVPLPPVMKNMKTKKHKHKSGQPLSKRETAEIRLAWPDKICGVCRDLSWPYLGSGPSVDLERLEMNASNASCYTCGLLQNWINQLTKGKGNMDSVELVWKETLELRISFKEGELRSRYVTWQLHTELSTNLPLVMIMIYNAEASTDSSVLWTSIQPLPKVPGNTGSDVSLLWLLRKIDECSRSHELCSNTLNAKSGVALPTRLLDLGTPNWPKDPCLISQYLMSDIKLCEAASGSRGRYLCLSHCWGQTNSMLKTTRSNYNERLQNIGWLTLPLTFRDAVVFARKLRIQYLWIDSLCIIQDDKEDWTREAAKMSYVYEKAFLTLSAITASDCNDGLFAKPSSDELKDPRSRKIETTPWEVYARRKVDHSIISTIHDKSPLLKRGWVYQERLLSRRILHFGPQELIWECKTMTTCECSMAGPQTPKRSHEEALASGSETRITSRWHEVVGEYSKLALTFDSDRLPALQGLAARFQTYKPFRYIAGLWERSLVLDLLWYSEHSTSRPARRIVPTWSWASVTSSVSYQERSIIDEIDTGAEVAHVSSTWDGKRPKQEGDLGRITLLGHLVPVDHEPQELRDNRPSWRRHSVRARGSTQSIFVSSDFHWYEDGPEKLAPEEELSFFLLARRYDHLYCLVLRRVKGLEDYYERIGITLSYQNGVERVAFQDVNLDEKTRVHLI